MYSCYNQPQNVVKFCSLSELVWLSKPILSIKLFTLPVYRLDAKAEKLFKNFCFWNNFHSSDSTLNYRFLKQGNVKQYKYYDSRKKTRGRKFTKTCHNKMRCRVI